MTNTIQSFSGSDVAPYFDDLARLRATVFRDFPYLYEGDLDYELGYLKTYANAERAMLFSVWDAGEMVGATTCIPLPHETNEVKLPFETAGIPLTSVFYFGESILLKNYRGQGIGKLFFDEREKHAAQFPEIQTTCFCAVVRPEAHPLMPKGYQSLDGFWTQRGYQKNPALRAQFAWPDIG